jgi:hypothetical protein
MYQGAYATNQVENGYQVAAGRLSAGAQSHADLGQSWKSAISARPDD